MPVKYLSTILVFFAFLVPKSAIGQISFGSYYNYSVTLMPENGGALNFGTLIVGQGAATIGLLDAGVAIFSIEGVKYLDVTVDITSPGFVYLDGDSGCPDSSCRIAFTSVGAAYANRGNENVNQAVIMNSFPTTFAVKYRGNAPPGPPPTPAFEGLLPNAASNMETAYLYIYASLNVGSHIVGSYSSNINISINYD